MSVPSHLPRRPLSGFAVLTIAGLLATACAAAPRSDAVTAVEPTPGLSRVDSKRLDVVEIRPGIRFDSFDSLFVEAPALGFRGEGGSQNANVSTQQLEALRDELGRALGKALADLEALPLVDTPGPATLTLGVTVTDITATVAPQGTSRGGWGSLLLKAVGEATLILELTDSDGRLLARGVDARAIEGKAMSRDGGMVTHWEGAQALCADWAAMTRAGLAALLEKR